MLFRKRRRWKHPTFEELGIKRTDHAGVCLNKGQVNAAFTDHVCDCTGWRFDKFLFGQAFCKCGDPLLDHPRIAA